MEADSQTVTKRLLVTLQVMLSDWQNHGIQLPLQCSEKFEKTVRDRPNETLSINKGTRPAAGKLESGGFPLTHLVIASEFYIT